MVVLHKLEKALVHSDAMMNTCFLRWKRGDCIQAIVFLGGHVAQAARRLVTGSTARVRSRVSEGWRFSSLLRIQTAPHSPTLTSLYLRHSSFYSPSVASPTSQALHLRYSSLSNPSAAVPTSQLILQPFRRFTYVTGHSTTLRLFHLRHRHFTYFTWRAAHAQRYEKTACGGLDCYSQLS